MSSTDWEDTETAIQRGADHADRVHAEDDDEDPRDAWRKIAKQFLWQYIKRIGDRKFTVNEARRWAEQHGCLEPPTKRAWGSIILAARRAGVVVRVGYVNVQYESNNSHATPAAEWQRAS